MVLCHESTTFHTRYSIYLYVTISISYHFAYIKEGFQIRFLNEVGFGSGFQNIVGSKSGFPNLVVYGSGLNPGYKYILNLNFFVVLIDQSDNSVLKYSR